MATNLWTALYYIPSGHTDTFAEPKTVYYVVHNKFYNRHFNLHL